MNILLTAQKRFESRNLRCILRKELINFERILNSFNTSKGTDKIDAYLHIRKELNASSPFTAFKRWMVKDNALSELLDEIYRTR